MTGYVLCKSTAAPKRPVHVTGVPVDREGTDKDKGERERHLLPLNSEYPGRCDVTAEQGCEGRDEFTNGSPRDQWVGGKEVGRGEGVTVHAGEGMEGGLGGYRGLQRMNNLMWQLHMQQLDQLNGGFSKPQQRPPPASGHSGGGASRQHDNTPYRHHSTHMNSGGRNQRYADDSGSGRHQQQNRNTYHQSDRSGSRHHESRGGHRHHDDRGGNRGYQDNRWRRY
ncbi:hypothetical protein INR49_015917 [Caranx melampygus]|nr:hypothetical protein INR49_015917 [Caranx melampygus]